MDFTRILMRTVALGLATSLLWVSCSMGGARASIKCTYAAKTSKKLREAIAINEGRMSCTSDLYLMSSRNTH